MRVRPYPYLLLPSVLAARNRGIKLLHMTCLAHNRRMQQLARKFDADLTFDFGSATALISFIRLYVPANRSKKRNHQFVLSNFE